MNSNKKKSKFPTAGTFRCLNTWKVHYYSFSKLQLKIKNYNNLNFKHYKLSPEAKNGDIPGMVVETLKQVSSRPWSLVMKRKELGFLIRYWHLWQLSYNIKIYTEYLNKFSTIWFAIYDNLYNFTNKCQATCSEYIICKLDE